MTEEDLDVHLGRLELGTANTLAIEPGDPERVAPGDTAVAARGEAAGTVEIEVPKPKHQQADVAVVTQEMVANEVTNCSLELESGASENKQKRMIARDEADDGGRDSGPPEHTRWKAAAGSSGNPRHTVKADQAGSATDSLDLPVNLRTIEVKAKPVNRNADYQLIEIVGKGGMGLVHKAKQHSIDRFVAFKTIHKERAELSPESRRKFLREAQITGSLDHPNIVPIHDLGISDDGSLFYSMKLVDGTPWQDVFDGKTRDENLEILLKVCDAIGFAHAHEVIHRDLKPDNVMLGQFGEVLVMDWGLAVNLQRDLGRGFSLGGTPAYMAPEMAWHDKARIGELSDIYLLGAMLYQIVTGFPPHPGQTVSDCVDAAKRNDIIPVKDPEDPLVKIAMRAMASEPSKRYQSVAAFQAAIRQYRRNSESVALSQRADAALVVAMQQQDYQQYSKALFGFLDAIDIWPENEAAKVGLAKARLEYGRCAVKRGDFDLALQVLNPEFAAERALYQQAEKGKREAVEREKRIRRLRSAVLGTVSVALLGALIASGYLNNAKNRADKATKVAEENAVIAKEKESEAINAKRDADAANLQLKGKNAELEEAKTKIENSLETIKHQTEEIKNKNSVLESTVAELKDRTADKEQALAVANAEADRARKAQQAELVQSRMNLFQNYPAKLNLASVRLQRQQDVKRSRGLLNEIDELQQEMDDQRVEMQQAARELAAAGEAVLATGEPSSQELPTVAVPPTPLLTNWAYRRVKLLGNGDLPALSLGRNQTVTCMAAALRGNVVAIGTAEGSIHLITVVDGKLSPGGSKTFDEGRIEALCVSPLGETIVFCTAKGGFAWQPSKGIPKVLRTAAGAKLSEYAAGQLRIAKGDNVFSWRVDATGMPTEADKPEVIKIGGNAQQMLQLPGKADRFGVLSDQNGKYVRIKLISGDGKRLVTEGKAGGSLEFEPDPPLLKKIQFVEENLLLAGASSGEILPVRVDGGKLSLLSPLTGDFDKRPIRQIALSPNRKRMIVVGENASGLSLWRADNKGAKSWRFIRPMLGHEASQVIEVKFIGDSDTVVSVDVEGKCLLWNLNEFESRQRLDNRRLENAPVASALLPSSPTGPADLALTVDANGVINRWPINRQRESTGEADSNAPADWLYPGHAPGASLVDAAITPDGKWLVTSAVLESNSYCPDQKRQFCLWYLESRTLVYRWDDRFSGTPTLAIGINGSGDGITVCIGGSESQSFVDLKLAAGRQVADVDTKPTERPAHHWAMNPVLNEVALIGPDSFVAMYGRLAPHELLVDSLKANVDENAKKAAWDPSGKWLFLLQDNSVFAMQRNTQRGGRLFSVIPDVLVTDTRNVDMVAVNEAAGLAVHLAIRAVSENSSRFLTYDLVGGSNGPQLKLREGSKKTEKGLYWLLSQGASQPPKSISTAVAEKAGIDNAVLMRTTPDGKRAIFIDSTGDYSIFEFDAAGNPTKIRPARRGRCTSATFVADRLGGWRAATASSRGAVWIATSNANVIDGAADWKPLDHGLRNVNQVAFSADGQYLAVVGRRGAESEAGAELWKFDERGLPTNLSFIQGPEWIAWHPQQAEMVAWLPLERQLVRLDTIGGQQSIDVSLGKDLEVERAIRPITFYRESFADEIEPPRWYVVAAREGARPRRGAGPVMYENVYLVPYRAADADKVTNESASPLIIELSGAGAVSAIAASPTENLLAVGYASGTVSLWLAAPSLSKEPFEVFDFEDHRGSKVRSLQFDRAGNTLLSADEAGQEYAWRSTGLNSD